MSAALIAASAAIGDRIDLSDVPSAIFVAAASLPSHVGLRINRDGTIDQSEVQDSTTPNWVQVGTWVSPQRADIGDGYEVRFNFVSGDAIEIGTTGSWDAISSDQAIGNNSVNSGTTVTVSIRRGGVTLATSGQCALTIASV